MEAYSSLLHKVGNLVVKCTNGESFLCDGMLVVKIDSYVNGFGKPLTMRVYAKVDGFWEGNGRLKDVSEEDLPLTYFSIPREKIEGIVQIFLDK